MFFALRDTTWYESTHLLSWACHNDMTMINRLLILTLACISFTLQIQAQANKYSLTQCARAYRRDSISTPEQRQVALRACIIGKPFPAFSAQTNTGKKYSDTELKGKVVFVTSWFAACPSCMIEMPMLIELNE